MVIITIANKVVKAMATTVNKAVMVIITIANKVVKAMATTVNKAVMVITIVKTSTIVNREVTTVRNRERSLLRVQNQ